MKNSLIIVLLLAGFVSCSQFSVETPEGFAEVSRNGNSYRAISPEGFRFELSTRENDPKQSLDFWFDAYNYYMEESGYLSYGEAQQLESEFGKIYVSEWIVPYQGTQYIFGHALSLKGDQIILGEFAGPQDLYDQYKPKIGRALESIH